MKDLSEQIRENYLQVLEKIASSANRSGRNPAIIKLVVVSKAQPLTVVAAAFDAGVRIFGENYPEEAVEKISYFKGKGRLEWHMIGHLQSRKARLVAEAFDYLHSLDSLHLAEKLNSALADQDRILPVLLEMNVSGEQSKNGWPAWEESQWHALLPQLEQLAQFPQLRLNGLMAMPPLFSDPEMARPYFARLRKLCDFLSSKMPLLSLHELSMGTSADFNVAVEEGATIVRVGQAILGPRPARSKR